MYACVCVCVCVCVCMQALDLKTIIMQFERLCKNNVDKTTMFTFFAEAGKTSITSLAQVTVPKKNIVMFNALFVYAKRLISTLKRTIKLSCILFDRIIISLAGSHNTTAPQFHSLLACFCPFNSL